MLAVRTFEAQVWFQPEALLPDSTLPLCDLTCLIHPSAHFGPRKNALSPGQKLPVANNHMVVIRLSLVCRVPPCAFPYRFKLFPNMPKTHFE